LALIEALRFQLASCSQGELAIVAQADLLVIHENIGLPFELSSSSFSNGAAPLSASA
jgi:hypothetical protein